MFVRDRSRGAGEGGRKLVFVRNTVHRFSHFRFTDFHETWPEHVHLDVEWLHREILNSFSANGSLLPKKHIFGLDFVSNLGVNSLKTVRHRKSLSRKSTSLACPLSVYFGVF